MANAEPVDIDGEIDSLIKEYNSIYREYERMESSDEPSNSEEYQEDLGGLITRTTNLVHGVNKQNLFSQNECLKEIPCPQLRFLLLPALLGYFSGKQSLVGASSQDVAVFRMTSIKQSKVYYKDFLRLCRLYGIPSVPPDDGDDSDEDTIDDEVATKNTRKKSYQKDALTRKAEKVLRFKAKKSLESTLEDLFSKMNLEHVDDETQREYYVKLVEKWIISGVEELEFIDEEIDILNHMSKLSAGDKVKQLPPKTKPSRPFILTKSDMQKQVFGLGYPSIPTYTLDEFYEAQVRNGQFPDPSAAQASALTAEQEALAAEREEIVKEFEIETDNPERLQKARDWDDWKDDHRRGWGNRKNMG